MCQFNNYVGSHYNPPESLYSTLSVPVVFSLLEVSLSVQRVHLAHALVIIIIIRALSFSVIRDVITRHSERKLE